MGTCKLVFKCYVMLHLSLNLLLAAALLDGFCFYIWLNISAEAWIGWFRVMERFLLRVSCLILQNFWRTYKLVAYWTNRPHWGFHLLYSNWCNTTGSSLPFINHRWQPQVRSLFNNVVHSILIHHEHLWRLPSLFNLGTDHYYFGVWVNHCSSSA